MKLVRGSDENQDDIVWNFRKINRKKGLNVSPVGYDAWFMIFTVDVALVLFYGLADF